MSARSEQLQHPWVFTLISYLPVTLYAERLRLGLALVKAVGSSTVVARPMTGSVKDIARLWNLSQRDFLSMPSQSRAIVISQRHGNCWNITNSAILNSGHLIGQKPSTDEQADGGRPVTVNVSFITPFQRTHAQRKARRLAIAISGLEVVALVMIAGVLIYLRLFIGATLVVLLAMQIALQIGLTFTTTLAFAKSEDLSKDIKQKVTNGAALDVHVVLEHSNCSEMDVLVGYSSQLHALTNIPAHVHGWSVLSWTMRLLVLVLAGQAALLASLFGRTDRQVSGSAIWLVLYLLLLIPRHITDRVFLDSVISFQPAHVDRAKGLRFKGRKAALAFIATLHMSEGRVGRWEWLDVFMPDNQRRRDWQNQLEASELFNNNLRDAEIGLDQAAEVKSIVDEVQQMRHNPEVKHRIAAFAKATGVVLPP